MGHEHGRLGHQLTRLKHPEDAFIPVVAVAHHLRLTALDQQIVARLIAFAKQYLPRRGVQRARVEQELGGHVWRQSAQQRMPSQQCRDGGGRLRHIDICHSGPSGMSGRIKR
ncbi:hypothetical protein D3C87_1684630 [compost metagenome]